MIGHNTGGSAKASNFLVSFSDDFGESWQPPAVLPALVQPGCQGSVLAPSAASAKGLVIVSHPNNGTGYLPNMHDPARNHMTLSYSRRGWENWSQHVIFSGFSGYSTMQDLSVGSAKEQAVALIYERGEKRFDEDVWVSVVPYASLKTDDLAGNRTVEDRGSVLRTAVSTYSVTATRSAGPFFSNGDPSSRQDSMFVFNYNPSSLPLPDGGQALAVRAQCGGALACPFGPTASGYYPDVVAISRQISESPLRFAPITNASFILHPEVFDGLSNEKCGVQDPRVTFDEATQTYYMTYTCWDCTTYNLCLAVCTGDPTKASCWKHRGRMFENNQTKSGSLLIMPKPPHFLFYGAFPVLLATTMDLKSWTQLPGVLLPQRAGSWDAGMETGPMPMKLSDGNFVFVFNGVCTPGKPGCSPLSVVNTSVQYAPGWCILNGSNPAQVLKDGSGELIRAKKPMLIPSEPWELGTGKWTWAKTKGVVFAEGWRRLGPDRFLLSYGGADTVVGAAEVTVKIKSDDDETSDLMSDDDVTVLDERETGGPGAAARQVTSLQKELRTCAEKLPAGSDLLERTTLELSVAFLNYSVWDTAHAETLAGYWAAWHSRGTHPSASDREAAQRLPGIELRQSADALRRAIVTCQSRASKRPTMDSACAQRLMVDPAAGFFARERSVRSANDGQQQRFSFPCGYNFQPTPAASDCQVRGVNIADVSIGIHMLDPATPRQLSVSNKTVQAVLEKLDALHAAGVRASIFLSQNAMPASVEATYAGINTMRQEGHFFGYDIDHRAARVLWTAMFDSLLPRIGAHPAIYGYLLANEPEFPTFGGQYAYAKLHAWLINKYNVTEPYDVSLLNKAWGTNWKSFDAVANLTFAPSQWETWRPESVPVSQWADMDGFNKWRVTDFFTFLHDAIYVSAHHASTQLQSRVVSDCQIKVSNAGHPWGSCPASGIDRLALMDMT